MLRSCNQNNEHITLKCKYNNSQGICIWKRENKSINAEKMTYCDDKMCCLNISNFSKDDAGPYTCFMYADVIKAEVIIPYLKENNCGTGASSLKLSF